MSQAALFEPERTFGVGEVLARATKAITAAFPSEVWVRGANVFRGYWRRPEETAHAMPAVALTASAVASPSDRFARAMVAFWRCAAARSLPPVIVSPLATSPVLKSTMTSVKEPPETVSAFHVYTESGNAPSSISYYADSGVPSRALTARPRSSGSHAPTRARASSRLASIEPGSAWAGNLPVASTMNPMITIAVWRLIPASSSAT